MIVVDASVVVSALVEDPVDNALRALLGDEGLHAPALLDFEVASALRGLLLGGSADGSVVTSVLADFTSLHIHRHPMTAMLGRVLMLRDNFTAYDAAYVVLAAALGCRLLTADAKLAEARRLGVDVQLL